MTILHRDDQTIIAQCTPQGSGAVALLRLSGTQAVVIAEKMSQLASRKKLTSLPTHTIHYGTVVAHDGTCVDQVLFLLMRAPKTFTGQDTVEITCHNNQFIIQAIVERAIACGARTAQAGEFAQRSFENGKLDLTQAEAINELIHAATPQALKKALSQVEGSFSSWVDSVEQELLRCLAFSEASFEFLDDEIEFGDQIVVKLDALLEKITYMKQCFDQQQQIRTGVRIALVGSVNAGKSSLFNAFLQKERAIVTPIEGTTRDVIEAGAYHEGTYWTYVDTAGLRVTNDIVEQEGIKRSTQEASLADLVLLVQDGSRKAAVQERKIYADLYKQHKSKCILVRSKVDASQVHDFFTDEKPYDVSVNNPETVKMLQVVLQEKIAQLFKHADSPYLLNKRHYQLLCSLEGELKEIKTMVMNSSGYELLSVHLRDALEMLSELTGKTVSEKGMDAVFREFCVGK